MHDGGLVHVHQGRTDVFAQADGLSGGLAYRFLEDREGNVWVATDQGLDRFRDFATPTLSAKQGLSTDSVWSVLTGKDGSVWLGTREGLNKWNGENLLDSSPTMGDDGACRPWSLRHLLILYADRYIKLLDLLRELRGQLCYLD
jgi:ligand-binding sensor domain-containing protein